MLSNCFRRLSAIRGTAKNTLLPSFFGTKTPTKGGHYDFTAHACVNGKSTSQGGILGCASATRRISSLPDTELHEAVNSMTPREVRAVFCLYDYDLVEQELERRGIGLQNMSTTEKEKVVIDKYDFQLLSFFSLPFTKSKDPIFSKLIDARNLMVYANYSEEEFEFVLQFCKENPAFLTKFKRSISDVEIVVAKLRSIRQSVHMRYEFEVTKEEE